MKIKRLIEICEQELDDREYVYGHQQRVHKTWDDLVEWIDRRGIAEFNAEVGYQYCDEVFGGHISSTIKRDDTIGLRAVRMLITYQRDGDFEFRTPAVEYEFQGATGQHMEAYISYLRNEQYLSESTLQNKLNYLWAFKAYLETNHVGLDEITLSEIETFYSNRNYSLASRHNCSSALRLFLRYAYDKGTTSMDRSIFVQGDHYKKHCKLPTTYTEDEIGRMLAAVDRGSAIGKRDYLILLLAAEYGWRSSDIVNFTFSQIDWDHNKIMFNQHKTDIPVVYPLLSSVGNAIIEYLKSGRPRTDTQEVIVSAETAKRGQKLVKTTVHSIVTKYMRLAGISDWENKRHGAHSLRHSLATNMLKKNIAMPIISVVLGHQTTESTKIYLSVDTDKLRGCALQVPALQARVYEVGL